MKKLFATLLALTTSLGFALPVKNPTAIAAGEIDALLAKDWKANKLSPNSPADDSTFVRRLYLDITGRIPTTREVEEFMSSKSRLLLVLPAI